MKKNIYPGKFIVFEGLDGSGQSTQANLLKNFLIKKRFKVILTKEPTVDSEAGKIIQEVLNKKFEMAGSQLQEFFARDRKEHLENLILPALKKGKIVISDRYFFSSFAYGKSDDTSLKWLIKINNQFLLPDITFLLKVSPEVCLERIKKRNEGKKRTLFEEKKKLSKVWDVYQTLPKRFENIFVIDGEKSIVEASEEIKKIIKEKFNFKE